jgi:hypothetical protein
MGKLWEQASVFYSGLRGVRNNLKEYIKITGLLAEF